MSNVSFANFSYDVLYDIKNVIKVVYYFKGGYYPPKIIS